MIAEANFTPVIIEAVRKAKSGTVADAIAQAKARQELGKRGPKIDGDSIKYERGTTNNNVLRRLARDGHDELLDQIEAGEISVCESMITKQRTTDLGPRTFKT